MFVIPVRDLGSGSPLINFKVAWKVATVLALVTEKHCSNLTLLCIENQHLFVQCHAAVFILASGCNID